MSDGELKSATLSDALKRARRKANVFQSTETADPLVESNRFAPSFTQYARPVGAIADQDEVLAAIPEMPKWTAERGRDEIKAAELRGVEAASRTRDFGGRTFPTATMINGTPMGTDATGVMAKIFRNRAEMQATFRGDEPGTIKGAVYEDEVKTLTSPRRGIMPLEKSAAFTDPSSPTHPLSRTAMLKEQKQKAATAWDIIKEKAGAYAMPMHLALEALSPKLRQKKWAPPMREDMRRLDGNVKGPGFMGTVKHKSGGDMTELSVGLPGTEEGFYPLLGPWLSKKEIDTLQSGGEATPSMYKKAREAARKRKAKGEPEFAPPGHSSGPRVGTDK